jgi:hypothetical protein
MPAPTIPLHPNVLVQITHSGNRPLNRPLDHPFEGHIELAERIDAWRSTGATLLFYAYNPISAMAQAPYSAGQKFRDDVRWLHARGFVGYHAQSDGTLWGFYGLNYTALLRTLWNAKLDFGALQRDYFHALFGGAAEPVRQLHVLFERALSTHPPSAGTLGEFLSAETLAQARRLLNEAGEAERSDGIRARLGVLAAQVEYGGRLMAARRAGEAYLRDGTEGTRLAALRAKEDLLAYVGAHPVDGAYHLGGVRYGLDLYLVGDRKALREEAHTYG